MSGSFALVIHVEETVRDRAQEWISRKHAKRLGM